MAIFINSATTIPNKLVKKLENSQDNSEEMSEILNCLVAFRPLSQEKALKALKQSLDLALKLENLDMIYLVVKTQSLLLCPKEFLTNLEDNFNDILNVVNKNLEVKKSCETISTIFKIATNDSNSNWMQRTILGPLKGQCLISDLLKNLSSTDSEVRFWTLNCLNLSHPNARVFEIMLQIEATEPNFQHYRDRANLLTNLAWDCPNVQAVKEDEISVGIFKFLLAQLSLNFKLMWEPTFKVIESHDNDKNSELWTSW